MVSLPVVHMWTPTSHLFGKEGITRLTILKRLVDHTPQRMLEAVGQSVSQSLLLQLYWNYP